MKLTLVEAHTICCGQLSRRITRFRRWLRTVLDSRLRVLVQSNHFVLACKSFHGRNRTPNEMKIIPRIRESLWKDKRPPSPKRRAFNQHLLTYPEEKSWNDFDHPPLVKNLQITNRSYRELRRDYE